MGSRLRTGMLCAALLTGFALGLVYAVPKARSLIDVPRGELTFYDFRLFNSIVVDVAEGKPLYRTEQRDFFDPGSAVYKYPPPYAAMLSFHASPRWRPVSRIFLAYSALSLVLSAVLLAAAVRAGPGRTGALIVLLLLWKPVWESLSGLQVEPGVLVLLSLGLFGMERGPRWLEGVGIGVAGALKVYPGLLVLSSLADRRWRAVLVAGVSALVVLALGAVILPFRFTLQYFTEILPHLGGTSGQPENVGIAGQSASILLNGYRRLDLALTDGRGSTIEALGVPTEVWVTRIVLVLAAVLLIAVTGRTIRKLDRPRRGPLRLILSLPILLLIMPTSWLDYQSLLFLPVGWLVLALPWRRGWLGAWTLLAVSVLPALIFDANDPAFGSGTPGIVTASRALLPLGVWGAAILALRAGDTGWAHSLTRRMPASDLAGRPVHLG